MRPMMALAPEQHLRIHDPPGHRQDRDGGFQALSQLRCHRSKLLGSQQVRAADQHQIGRFQLIGEQVLEGIEVIQAGIGTALLLHRCRITDDVTGRQSLAIHHRDDGMNARAGADGWPAEGIDQRSRQRQAAGFHHDPIQLVGVQQQFLQGGQEVVLDGAAEATVGQLHQAALQLVLGAEPTAGDQVAIDANLPEFIDQDRQALTAAEQQVAEQAGLAGPQEPRHHGDREAGGNGMAHLRTSDWRRSRPIHRQAERWPGAA